ncbi:MAG: hypothetical protein ACE5IJ_04505 [Thermoplasmata archaeon]
MTSSVVGRTYPVVRPFTHNIDVSDYLKPSEVCGVGSCIGRRAEKATGSRIHELHVSASALGV